MWVLESHPPHHCGLCLNPEHVKVILLLMRLFHFVTLPQGPLYTCRIEGNLEPMGLETWAQS